MGCGNVPAGTQEAVHLFRNKAAIWDVIAVRAPHKGAVASYRMVEVHRICRHTDGIVETGAVEYVLFRQDIFTYDAPALPYSHERGDTVHIGILETRDESLEVADDFGVLPDADFFSLGILVRIGSIHFAFG